MRRIEAARLLAESKHDQLVGQGRFCCARDILDLARKSTGIKVIPAKAQSPLLGGANGALRSASEAIFLSTDLTTSESALVEAHEFGHYWLEQFTQKVTSRAGIRACEGSRCRLCRYCLGFPASSFETERMADVFASNFLLPRAVVAMLYYRHHLGFDEISALVGIPARIVLQQLAEATSTRGRQHQMALRTIVACPGPDPMGSEELRHHCCLRCVCCPFHGFDRSNSQSARDLGRISRSFGVSVCRCCLN